MESKNKITFICSLTHETSEGFKILFDDQDITGKIERGRYNYSIVHECKSGKHKLVVIQNNFVQSKWWWILSLFYGLLAMISGSFEEYTEGIGPYYAYAEGELLITGDAAVEIKLSSKRINKNRVDCCFNIDFKNNCSWTEIKNDFITSKTYKRRWIFASVLPAALLAVFIGLLCGRLGVRAFSKGQTIFGLFNMIIVVLILVAFVYHVTMTIKKADNRI